MFGFWTIFQAPCLAPHWLDDFADSTLTAATLTDKTPLPLSKAPAASQSTYVMDQLYFTGD